ncbi:MAG: transglycosylase SLT domain-containing protein [Rhodocyclales bacterium]|nr:transglycosylase SLT domain-containing protein [Rhodocyclales bacterium]
MSNESHSTRLLHRLASVFVRFAHGGLLVVGVLTTLFLAGRIGALDGKDFGSQEVSGLIGEARWLGTAAASGAENLLAPPEMRGVVDYLSRRYRVAAPAIEPLISAARIAGERVGLDPMLIVAVMAIESGFNPIAESPMGAQGLMQVIPRFHQDKLGEGAGPDALLDPLVNIQVGARVLKESIRRAGSLEAGLQQYAGAANDDETQYAVKVLAEKQRLGTASRRGRPQTGA